MNVITLFTNVYVPSPGTFTSVVGDPSFPTNVVVVGSNATFSWPLLKFTVELSSSFLSNTIVDVWGCAFGPSVAAFSPSGVTGVTVGTYFFVTTFPFSSSTWTVTPSAVPLNVLTGVNVIAPSFNSYVPTSGTVIVVTFSLFSFTNVNVSCFNSTLSWPVSKFTVVLSASSFWLNTIGDVWVNPCNPVVAESLPVGVTSITVGV